MNESRKSRRVSSALPLLLGTGLLLLCGCVKKEGQGAEITWSFETWLCWAGVGAGALLALFGFCLDKKPVRSLLLIVGGGLLAFFSPDILHQSVTVGPEQIELGVGSWWTPEKKTIKYSDLTEIRKITEKQEGGFFSLTPARSYLFILRTGAREKVPRGQLVDEAEDRILEIAAEKGVLISGEWADGD